MAEKKYYRIGVAIKGYVLVPVDEYDDRGMAVECIQTSDADDIGYMIKENNDDPCFIRATSIEEVEY